MSKFYSLGIIIICIGAVVFLQSVFSGNTVLPQSLNIGFLNIHYYGLILALAVLSAYGLANYRRIKFNFTTELQDKLVFLLIIGGFIGARIYHVISDYSLYSANPIKIFAILNGGLSIYGAIFGGVLTLWLFVKCHSGFHESSREVRNLKSGSQTAFRGFWDDMRNISKYLDWLTPSLLVGQIIGRLGNFFNYELYGLPTSVPFKMFVPFEFRLQGYVQFEYFHPLFLYEILVNLIILAGLFLLERKVKLKNGQLFLSYIVLYNSVRFGLEFLRIDAPIYFGIHLNTVVSLGLALAALSLLYWSVYASKIPQN